MAASDLFNEDPIATLTSPAVHALMVTPNDSTDLPFVTRGLYFGSAGNVEVMLSQDTNPVLFTNVSPGTILSIRVRRVYATNTTATGIVALW